MKIVEYKVEIAAFEPDAIPDKDTIESVLEEAIENIETNGGNVTVRSSFVCEAVIDPLDNRKPQPYDKKPKK